MKLKVDYLIVIAILALFVASIGMIATDRSDDGQEDGNVPPDIGLQPTIDYVYWDSQGHLVKATCDEYVTMSGSRLIHTTMYTGWYLFDGLNTEQDLSVVGEAKIILADDSTINRLQITNGSSLHIFSISDAGDGQGVLNVVGKGLICGYNGASVSISIHSGTVDASTVRTVHDGSSTIGGGVNGHATIVIDGGVVKSNAQSYGSAIGCGQNGTCDITINGGEVEVSSRSNATGIGSGEFGESNITINGGNVVAHAEFGTGIGSADRSNTEIIIKGGDIKTYGRSAVCIGSGVDGKSTIDIRGGKVYAKTNGSPAAIGCSSSQQQYKEGVSASTISISGGEVTAVSEGAGAAIGSAFMSKARIYISGGTIDAYGHNLGAAIGSGNYALAEVNISGGTIKAFSDGQGAAVGSGKRGDVTMSIYVDIDASTTGDGWAIGPGVSGKCTMLAGEQRR